MGNLCSIFHMRFKNLMKVIPSARKAQLVDYILLGWQKSSYTLKNSTNKWFMKPYAEIVEDTGIPKSTLERYIKELVEDGFIERRQALYSRTKEQGGFEVKKGNYIHITDKLLELIKPSQPGSENPSNNPTDTHNKKDNAPKDNHSNKGNIKTPCATFDINEGTDPLNMRGSYIRDLYPSLENNISLKQLTHSVDKSALNRLTHQYEAIHKLLYTEIKEELPNEVKRLVSGTFYNLTFQHNKWLSSPKQLAAEYLFCLINTEYYLPHVTCFTHRNNILSKMVRENQWRTPKGFYKHFYLGQSFKDKQELQALHWQNQKNAECSPIKNDLVMDCDPRLAALENDMHETAAHMDELTARLHEVSNEEDIAILREHIKAARSKLESLWQQQRLIEQENEPSLGHCA